MWHNLWEATVYVGKKTAIFFGALSVVYVGIHDWASRFSDVKSFSSFILPRVAAFIVGILLTPFSWPVVLLIALLPTPAAGMIYLFSILVVLKQ
jgi:hypothetical protein